MCECVSDCLPIAAQIMSHCGFACQADGGISSAVYGHAPPLSTSRPGAVLARLVCCPAAPLATSSLALLKLDL